MHISIFMIVFVLINLSHFSGTVLTNCIFDHIYLCNYGAPPPPIFSKTQLHAVKNEKNKIQSMLQSYDLFKVATLKKK